MDEVEINCTAEEATEMIKKAFEEAERKMDEIRESIKLTPEDMRIPYYAQTGKFEWK